MRALITGITGQDGSYLAELLLANGYEVHGLVRTLPRAPGAAQSFANVTHIAHRITFHCGDLLDAASLRAAVHAARPVEVYHLAGESAVRSSFASPERATDVLALGTLRLLEAVRAEQDARGQTIRFYQAGSSEMFGAAQRERHDECVAFRPRTPYGVAKLCAHWHVVAQRETHGLFAVNGILFNHESPRRRDEFVSRKITRAAVRIRLGLQAHLELGNLEARRDWGFAGDYVEAMWRMLQQPRPDDYVIASGATHSVRDWCELAFALVGLRWERFVRLDSRLLRPAEPDAFAGDTRKAERELGWRPRLSFDQLVAAMVQADWQRARCETGGWQAPEGWAISCG